MRKCNKCEHEYADEFDFCPHCGEAYVKPSEVKAEEQAVVKEFETVLSSTNAGKKLVAHERKNHYIQNALLLLFSLILFVCSFFTGAKFLYTPTDIIIDSDFSTNEYAVELSNKDLIDGVLATFQEDGAEMQEFLFGEQIYFKTLAAFQTALLQQFDADDKENQKIIAAIETLDFGLIRNLVLDKIDNEKFCKDLGKNLTVDETNYLKAFIYSQKTLASGTDYVSSTNEVKSIFVGIGLVNITMKAAFAVTAFVFAIIALIALLRRSQVKNPFLAAFLPLIFNLIDFLMLTVSGVFDVSTAGAVALAVNLLFIVVLFVHKCLFEQDKTSLNKQLAIKNAVIFAISAIACFTVCRTLFNMTLTLDPQIHSELAVNSTHIFNTVFLVDSVVRYGGGSSGKVFGLSIFLFVLFFASLLCLILLLMSASKLLYKGNSRTFIAGIVTSVVFIVLSVIITVVLTLDIPQINQSKYAPSSIQVFECSLGASPFISLIMCIAAIVVKQAWNTSPKIKSSNQE